MEQLSAHKLSAKTFEPKEPCSRSEVFLGYIPLIAYLPEDRSPFLSKGAILPKLLIKKIDRRWSDLECSLRTFRFNFAKDGFNKLTTLNPGVLGEGLDFGRSLAGNW